jgi:hypothetical protein
MLRIWDDCLAVAPAGLGLSTAWAGKERAGLAGADDASELQISRTAPAPSTPKDVRHAGHAHGLIELRHTLAAARAASAAAPDCRDRRQLAARTFPKAGDRCCSCLCSSHAAGSHV